MPNVPLSLNKRSSNGGRRALGDGRRRCLVRVHRDSFPTMIQNSKVQESIPTSQSVHRTKVTYERLES